MIYRKSILGCLASLVAIVALSACFHEEDFGYQKNVTMGAEGGKITVFGTESVDAIDIYEGDTRGELTSMEDIEFEVNDSTNNWDPRLNSEKDSERFLDYTTGMKLPWVKVISICNYEKPHIVIRATPNTTGNKRKIRIELFSCNKYQVMTFVQGAQ